MCETSGECDRAQVDVPTGRDRQGGKARTGGGALPYPAAHTPVHVGAATRRTRLQPSSLSSNGGTATGGGGSGARPRSTLSASSPRGVGADLLFGAFGMPLCPPYP